MRANVLRLRAAHAVVLAVFVGCLTGLMTAPALGHDGATYFPARWQVDLRPDWSFTSTFPGGDWRARVRDGVTQWNLAGQPLVWEQIGQRADFNPDVCPGTAATNAVHWRNIPDNTGALAYTTMCRYANNPQRMWSANIVFDSSRNWYTGTGDAPDGLFNNICALPPDCQWDAWSVASHEWGHASGFNGPFDSGHFNRNESICESNSSQHTMCPSLSIGTERMRTLEVHDRHTFDNAY